MQRMLPMFIQFRLLNIFIDNRRRNGSRIGFWAKVIGVVLAVTLVVGGAITAGVLLGAASSTTTTMTTTTTTSGEMRTEHVIKIRVFFHMIDCDSSMTELRRTTAPQVRLNCA